MSQQINLLNPALIKQKDLLNPNTIALTLVLLIMLMMAYYVYAQKQLAAFTIQRDQTAIQLTTVQTQLTQTASLHKPREADKSLQLQIIELEQKEKMQRHVLQTLDSSSATTNGYAALMRAFARQTVEGLWLTSFNIDSSTDKLNISGRTTQADLLPTYITRLANEPVLQGKSFATLNMHLTKTNIAAESKPSGLATTVGNISPATGEALNKNNNKAQAASKPVVIEPASIEFKLQSTTTSQPAPVAHPATDNQKVGSTH